MKKMMPLPWGVCSCKPACTAHSSLIHGQPAAKILSGQVQVMGRGAKCQARIGVVLTLALAVFLGADGKDRFSSGSSGLGALGL